MNPVRIHERGILVHPEELTLDWLHRMAAAKLNTLGLHPVGGPKAHESLQAAIEAHATPQSRALRQAAASLGIAVEYEAHAAAWLLPREEFARNPAWFRMNAQGERTADFNLCASNREALAFVAERASRLAALLDTGATKHFLWLDDVKDCSCHCPDCRGLTPSDQQLRVVNAMLGGLKQRDPRARLCYIAYHDALAVPRKTEPVDGVFLEYAPIGRNHHRPINDPDCPENVRESRALPDLVRFFGTKDARVLEYWMDNSLCSNWTKPPRKFALDEATMQRDVAYYRELGFGSMTSFGCYLGPDYQQLHGEASLEAYGRILREG